MFICIFINQIIKHKIKKKIFKLAAILFISAIAFNGCKKGEDDPFISMRSRTARLAGKWKLTSMDKTVTNSSNSYTSSTHYSYSGTTMTSIYTQEGNSYTTTKEYTEYLTTKSDGTYTLSINDEGDISAIEGNWMWLKGNKKMQLANKESVLFSITKSIYGTDITNYSGKSNFDEVNVINKLANKELVILYDYTSVSTGSTNTTSGTMTYTQE